jgi:hypothetical protein
MRRRGVAAVFVVLTFGACSSGEDSAVETTTTTVSDFVRYSRAARSMGLTPMTEAESSSVAANVCDNTVSDFAFVARIGDLDVVVHQAIVVEVWCPGQRLQYDQGMKAGGMPVVPSVEDVRARLG